ncbi:hypothetical protein VNO77_06615 [Canavalia gladiata]|uniref:Uncharacterized protein n=1 Tax=Canavalia gladiata TaxID=3824 RepID=A0AAN9MCI0_CANGL
MSGRNIFIINMVELKVAGWGNRVFFHIIPESPKVDTPLEPLLTFNYEDFVVPQRSTQRQHSFQKMKGRKPTAPAIATYKEEKKLKADNLLVKQLYLSTSYETLMFTQMKIIYRVDG